MKKILVIVIFTISILSISIIFSTISEKDAGACLCEPTTGICC